MPTRPDHNMFDDTWEESSFAEVIYDLGFDIGFEEGLKRACEELRIEGMRAFVQKALERRFGSLSEALGAAADKATLVDILANAATLDEMKKRLGIS